ncbi:MAG: hypothetical protein IJS00_06780 [Paludibacteraceae bacterium]|nr:hypothetical protein [Paludibacteraceae bacterium]
MKVSLYTLVSPVHDKATVEKQIEQVRSALSHEGLTFDYYGSQYGSIDADDVNVFYVCTGGTEAVFLDLAEKHSHILTKKVYLLASDSSNSLAASVEILSWLQQNGYTGQILHGSSREVAQLIQNELQVLSARQNLQGKRAGIIGRPSDWLIASHADDKIVKKRLGIELVSIDIQELIDAINALPCDKELLPPIALRASDSAYWQGALRIYYALDQIRCRYHLDAFTLRCFDLLSAVHNTGCLALAIFNALGIPAACEGDVPALLTMMIAQELVQMSGFQANPSKIDTAEGEVLFAHCTAPVNMLSSYLYDTHFESGIGVAIHGELSEKDATVVKVSGNLKRWFAEDVTISQNTYRKNLCRTQIVVKAPQTAHYLLLQPIGNHQIIVFGHHKALFDKLLLSLQD